MACTGRRILGFLLAVIGFLGTIVICALPMWKGTTIAGANAVKRFFWEGLWMSCFATSLEQFDCEIYVSVRVLSQDMRVARVLIVVAIAACVVALGIAGEKCNNNTRVRAAGVVFICAGILVLIPICWTAYTVWTWRYRRELGASLYIGWFAAALLLLGGALLCCSSPPQSRISTASGQSSSAPQEFPMAKASC